MSNKTFNVVETEFADYLFLALPGSKVFRMKTIFDYGSNLEEPYERKYGKKVYGISHLTEHLCFKSPEGYETDELLALLKKHGNRNAGTNFTHINYFFNTIMDNMELAIDAVCSIGFNDFSRITEDEFEREKNVVISEVGRYMDDKQTMFNLSAQSAFLGHEVSDNILGTPEILKEVTLEDCINVRRLSLQEAKKYITVTYDPDAGVAQDEILEKILLKLDNMSINKTPMSIGRDEIFLPKELKAESKLDMGSDRSMITLAFETDTNFKVRNIANNYIAELANETSLFNVIRDKHSLTYGVSFYTDDIREKYYTRLNVDIEIGKEELFFKLLEESIVASVDKFNEEIFEEMFYSNRLKTIMRRTDVTSYEFLYANYVDHKDTIVDSLDLLSKDVTLVDDLLNNKYNTYEAVKEYLEELKDIVINKRYKKVMSNLK